MVDCSGFIQPLNLQCIFVNTFAESMNLFIFIAFIFIAAIGASMRMLNITVLLMFALFALLFSQYLGGLYLLIILIIGLILSYIVAKMVKN